MKKILFVLLGTLLLSFSPVHAEGGADWNDLVKMREHIDESIHEIDHFMAINKIDVHGHDLKAKEELIQASNHLHEVIEIMQHAQNH